MTREDILNLAYGDNGFIESLHYHHIGLLPTELSQIEHRSHCNTSVKFCNFKLDVPIIASPMADVCAGEMAYKLAELGAFGVIHRFVSIPNQIDEYLGKTIDGKFNKKLKSKIGCAIGVTGDYKERFNELYKVGCRIFLLDTANGFNIQVEHAVDFIRSQKTDKIYLIAGNIATLGGYEFLSTLGIDYIRVGVGTGNPCTTRFETGIYNHPISVLTDCLNGRMTNSDSKIIVDGGIKNPEDMCKVLALGADLIMAGSIFAGTDEAPGGVNQFNGTKYKLYRGAASYSTQREYKGVKPEYVEGEEKLVPYAGPVVKVIRRFKHGLQSSMSYCNAKNLNEYRNKVDFRILR